MRFTTPAATFAAIVATAPLLLSCGGDEPESREVLGTVSGHPVIVQDNDEGSDAPCIGVEVTTSEATSATMACPTASTDERQYAAIVDVGAESFVVGFGLAEGETIVDDRFDDVFVSDDVEGRRFFAVRVADGESVEVLTISDGDATRELRTT